MSHYVSLVGFLRDEWVASDLLVTFSRQMCYRLRDVRLDLQADVSIIRCRLEYAEAFGSVQTEEQHARGCDPDTPMVGSFVEGPVELFVRSIFGDYTCALHARVINHQKGEVELYEVSDAPAAA